MRQGVDWHASLALYKHIQKLNDPDGDPLQDELASHPDGDPMLWHAASLSCLELLLTGGFWPQQRHADIHQRQGVSALCPRCGKAEESALHCCGLVRPTSRSPILESPTHNVSFFMLLMARRISHAFGCVVCYPRSLLQSMNRSFRIYKYSMWAYIRVAFGLRALTTRTPAEVSTVALLP